MTMLFNNGTARLMRDAERWNRMGTLRRAYVSLMDPAKADRMRRAHHALLALNAAQVAQQQRPEFNAFRASSYFRKH